MRFSIFQDTLLGARTNNQDRMGYCFSRESLLMVVADGMGGHMRGEVAAEIALQTVAGLFRKQARPRLKSPAQFLNSAIRSAHRELHRYQSRNRLPESPRTTIVVCVLQQDRAWWAHAGDSRLYVVRDGKVLVRTRDHSKVESLLTMGFIDPRDVARHPDRNKVLNCLGSPFDPTVALTAAFSLRPGDRMLLCTDGLWSAYSDAEVARRLNDGAVGHLVPRLVSEAVRRSGEESDNTTAVALHWVGDDLGGIAADTLSTGAMPADRMTTTITMPTEDGALPSEPTEADLERTVAEIRSAIRRTDESRLGPPPP